MRCQKRTDTTHGNPAIHRWQLQAANKTQKERLAHVKSSIDVSPPQPQPHLTLYGRDYAAKKKATTEAAFADLKMIQAIARTMTRKFDVAERKGPMSLNADGRKAEIYRVMKDNHRLLDQIDNVGAFCNTQDLVADHKFKQRYVINSSHTARRAGEYDDEIQRIRADEKNKRERQLRSTQARKHAAGDRMRPTGRSASMPQFPATASSGHASPMAPGALPVSTGPAGSAIAKAIVEPEFPQKASSSISNLPSVPAQFVDNVPAIETTTGAEHAVSGRGAMHM